MTHLSKETLESHYIHLVDKPFFPDILKYMQSGAVLLQVWDGVDAASLVRKIVGATNPTEALPGTIRGDYSLNIARNIIHASETAEEGVTEVARFFDESELATYARCDEAMLYELDR
jgi:nucleoside-diphosphate kinase